MVSRRLLVEDRSRSLGRGSVKCWDDCERDRDREELPPSFVRGGDRCDRACECGENAEEVDELDVVGVRVEMELYVAGY